jgi:protein-S-isoprenylcysteine O-methyltransferase Ste14
MSMHLSPHDLHRKAWEGQAKGIVILLLLLMLPAWSLSFWQGWLFWLVFSISTSFISYYFLKHDPALVASRLRAGAGAEHEPAQKRIQTVAAVVGLLTYIMPGIERHFTGLPSPVSVVILGNAAFLAGAWIVFLAFRENSHASSIIEVKSGQRVIATGPYGVVRHPMYSGCVLAFIASSLALGSLWSLPFAIALSLVVVARLLDEEKYLKANLPGYTAFCQQVRYRLVPTLW